ncbi:MAG: hypothetical protein KDB61_10725, partial [Planctomycetes bacterium]|nr:hypothetical protein [Planctomycetota bacterium]
MAIKHFLASGALLIGGLLGAQAHAQSVEQIRFPLVPQPHALVPGTLDLTPTAGAFADLSTRGAVIMNSVPMPDGTRLDLDLTRVNFDFQAMGVEVNGVPTPYDPLDLSLWRGFVVGDQDSEVFLAFATYGCNGWIYTQGEYHHLIACAGPNNDWSQAEARLVPDTVMNDLGGARAKLCGNTSLPGGGLVPSNVTTPVGSTGGTTFRSVNRWTTLECKVAVETDYQYYQNWNNLTACQNYTATLLAEISDRYNTSLDVVLTYPYLQFYTSSNDPWTSQGGGSGAVLTEFRNAWAGNIPNGANLAHFMSGAALGGGVAYLDALCDCFWGFGVSGDMDG